MELDGRHIGAALIAETRARVARYNRVPLVVALVDDPTPVTASYLRIKTRRAEEAGCRLEVRPTSADTSDADAVVVQLPIRDQMAGAALCNAIPLAQDADVLSLAGRARFEQGAQGALLPPVVGAVRQILAHSNCVVAGRRAVVVGKGFLVGAPVAIWLKQQGALVEVVTEEAGALTDALARAQIVVLGAGSPGLITPQMIPEGVVLIDAGTSESHGKIVGDADPACAARCALYTPVPGGVGPVAVACLFANVASLVEQHSLH